MLIRRKTTACASPMLAGAEFDADVVLVAPRESEITRAQRTYREKNFTTFTELLAVDAFQTGYIKRLNEALGLESLAAYLLDAGIRAAIINCNVAPHTPAEVAAKVRASGTRIVGISLIYRPQVGFALDLLKALENVPDLQVCMGGALASFMPRELLGHLTRVDAVIFGEAEETFRDYCLTVLGRESRARWTSPVSPFPIVRLAEQPADDCSLPGLAYRDRGFPAINTAAAPLDLRKILAPARQTLSYLRAIGRATRIASLYTSRGCMAKCTFCTGKDAYNVERAKTYRFRDATHVVDEIQELHEAFGVRFFYINDDNFLGYGKDSSVRVRQIAEGLIARKLGIHFASECRVDGLDLELLHLLREAGMTQVLLGVESGSDSVLNRWRKGATVEQNRHAIELVKRAGIALEPGFILFDAHTTARELTENARFIEDVGLHHTAMPTYLVNRISVYPGTEIEQQWIADGTIAPPDIRYGEQSRNDPAAIIAYFQRMEYNCRDPRSEIAWRALRRGLEPVERFLEDNLPVLIALLAKCRGPAATPAVQAEARSLIRKAASWRRNVGDLVLRFVQRCARSYEITGHAAQWRWIRVDLEQQRLAFERETLGITAERFSEQVEDLSRKLIRWHVTVVIPTCGKWSRLQRTLESLARQNTKAAVRWEIVLVLDGVELPETLDPQPGDVPFRLVRLADRRGRGAARNAGVAASTADVIILLDDDMIVTSDFVQQHWDTQCSFPSLCHGTIRELTPFCYFDDLDRLTPATGIRRQSLTRVGAWAERTIAALSGPESRWPPGTTSRLERDGIAGLREGRMSVAWLAFAGANLSAPREWLVSLGFDESTGVRWGLEDISLALRWILAGRPLRMAEAALGLHMSHRRTNWWEEHRSNAACLAFLPAEITASIFDYLENRIEATDLGRALDAHFEVCEQPVELRRSTGSREDTLAQC